jgi:hypothetical protein
MLRIGVVPEPALERLSVGLGSLSAFVGARLEALKSGRTVRPLFILGEWGTGKSHSLAFIRSMARNLSIGTAAVVLNARSSGLNYPQRFYPTVVDSLHWEDENPGPREALTHSLLDPVNRKRLAEFSESPAAGDLGHQLRSLVDHFSEENTLFRDSEWAWTGLLGAHLRILDHLAA